MALEPFDVICPEIARAEMRVCETPGAAHLGLATKYFLREFYCTDAGCDCRRVLVEFLPCDGQFRMGKGEVLPKVESRS